MIIKSHIRGGYRAAASYLKAVGENESIRLVEMSDPDAKDLDEAFRNMWIVGRTTRAQKPLHHVSINPYKDERLTDAQVLKICARLEQKYGYQTGAHQRVMVEHIKDGRQHFHVMWNRVSMQTGRAVWPGHHWNKSKQAAREMEAELGLKRPEPRRLWAGMSVSSYGMHATGSRAPGFVKAVAPGRSSPCTSRPMPKPLRPLRRGHARNALPAAPLVLINPQMSREELIAWAWENSRYDILAQFGIYVSPDP
jgi:Relaxase/Mobilisation nuclease domain